MSPRKLWWSMVYIILAIGSTIPKFPNWWQYWWFIVALLLFDVGILHAALCGSCLSSPSLWGLAARWIPKRSEEPRRTYASGTPLWFQHVSTRKWRYMWHICAKGKDMMGCKHRTTGYVVLPGDAGKSPQPVVRLPRVDSKRGITPKMLGRCLNTQNDCCIILCAYVYVYVYIYTHVEYIHVVCPFFSSMRH
jgi:hypothetical protein